MSEDVKGGARIPSDSWSGGPLSPASRDTEAFSAAAGTYTQSAQPPPAPWQHSTSREAHYGREGATGIHDNMGMVVEMDELRRYQSQLDGFRAGGRYEDANKAFKTILKRLGGDRAEKHDVDDNIFDRLARLIGRRQSSKERSDIEFSLDTTAVVSKFSRIDPVSHEGGEDASAIPLHEARRRNKSRSHERSGSGPSVVYLSGEEIELLTYLQIVQAELEWRRKERKSFALHLLSAVINCTYNMTLRTDASVLATEILLSPYFEDLVLTINLQNLSEKNFADKPQNPEENHGDKQTNKQKDDGAATGSENVPAGTHKRRTSSDDSQTQNSVIQYSVRLLSSHHLQDLRILKENERGSRSVFGGAGNDKTTASLEIVRTLLQSFAHLGKCFTSENASNFEEDAAAAVSDQMSLGTVDTDSGNIERMTSATLSRSNVSTHKRARSKSHVEKSQTRPLPDSTQRSEYNSRSVEIQSSCSKMIHTLLRLCLNSIPYFDVDKDSSVLVQTSFRCLLPIRLHVLFGMLTELAQSPMLAIGHYLASWKLVLGASSQRTFNYDAGLSTWQEGVRNYESLLNGTYTNAQSDRAEDQAEFRRLLFSFVRGVDMVALLAYQSCKHYESSVKIELQELADSTYPYTYREDGVDLSKDYLNNVLSGTIDRFRSSSAMHNQSNWISIGGTASILPPVFFAEQATQSLSRSVCAAVTTSLMRAQSLFLATGLPMCALHVGLGMLHGESGLSSAPPLNMLRLEGLRSVSSRGFQKSSKSNRNSNGDDYVLWGLLSLLARSQVHMAVHITWLALNASPAAAASDIQLVLPWAATHYVHDYLHSPETLNYPFGWEKTPPEENVLVFVDDTSSKVSGSTSKQSAVKFRREFISELHSYPIWRWGSNFIIDNFLALSYCRLEGDTGNLDLCSLTELLGGSTPVHFSYEAPANFQPDSLDSSFIQALVLTSAQITFESAMVLIQNSDWNSKFWAAAAVGDLLSPGRDSLNRSEVGNLLPGGVHDFELGKQGYESSMFRLERGMLLADEALTLTNDSLKGFNESDPSRLDGTFLAKHFGKGGSKQENVISLNKGKHSASGACGLSVLCTRELPASFAKYFDPLLPNQLLKLLVAHTCFARKYQLDCQVGFVDDSIASALKEHHDHIDASEHGWHHGFMCQALQLLGVICLNRCGAECLEGYGGGPPRESLLPEATAFLKKAAGALSASHICWSVRYATLPILEDGDADAKELPCDDHSAYRLHSVSTLASIALKELAGHQWSLPDDELPEYEEEEPLSPVNHSAVHEVGNQIKEESGEEVIVEDDAEGESRQSGSHESLESSLFAKRIEEILSKGKIKTRLVHDVVNRVPASLLYHLFVLCCTNEDYGTMILLSEELFNRYRTAIPPPEVYTASVISLCLMAEYRNKKNRKVYPRQSLISCLETAASRLSTGLDSYPRNELLLWTQSIILQVCSSHDISLDSLRGNSSDEDSTSSKESTERGADTMVRKYDILAAVSLKRAAEVAHNTAVKVMHGRTIERLGSYRRQLNATELSPDSLAKYTTRSAASVHPPAETLRAVTLWCSFARCAASSGDRTSAFIAASNAEYLVELWNLHTPYSSCNVLIGHLLSAVGAIYECASDLLNAQTYYAHLEGLDYQGSLTPILRNIGIGLHRLAMSWEERKQQQLSTSRESDSALDVTRLHMRLDSYKVRLQSLLRRYPWCWQAWMLYSAALMQSGDHSSGVDASLEALQRLDRDCSLGRGGMMSFPAATDDHNKRDGLDCTDGPKKTSHRHRPSSENQDQSSPHQQVEDDVAQQGDVPPWNISSVGWSQVRGIHLASMLPLTLHRPLSAGPATCGGGGGTGIVGDGGGSPSEHL
eukprot:gb/GECG01013053.1/.p1 GENE.gb/GECG01013053.1/~~gb/GECG01013053.1/.p1  ORF type:complete len:1855 (+),score=205.09 gb/GECG01013053.1/:1-5565(+)